MLRGTLVYTDIDGSSGCPVGEIGKELDILALMDCYVPECTGNELLRA